MAITANSRSIWFGTGMVFIFWWTLLHSTGSSERSLRASNLLPGGYDVAAKPEETSIVVDANRDPSEYQPGDTIPASAWQQELVSASPEVSGVQQNNDYDQLDSKGQGDLKGLGKSNESIAQEAETNFGLNVKSMGLVTDPNRRITAQADRPLIIYAYFETENAKTNLRFFVDHGLHGAADFVFILNGETDVHNTIIYKDKDGENGRPKRDMSNVYVIKRGNTCFDLGAHTEVLSTFIGGEGWYDKDGPIPLPEGAPMPEKKPEPVTADEDIEENVKANADNSSGEAVQGLGEEGASSEATNGDQKFGNSPPRDKRSTDRSQPNGNLTPLRYRYKRFILMNASIRGPFLPPWSSECWSDAYTNRVTSKIKLVGMSYNCHWGRGHVQSMIWATDTTGLEVILEPEGIGECFPTMEAAVEGEIRTTRLLRERGFAVDAFLSVYHSHDERTRNEKAAGKRLMAEKKAKWEEERVRKNAEKLASTEMGLDGVVDGDEGRTTEEPEDEDIKPTEEEEEEEVVLGEPEVPGDFWKGCGDGEWLARGGYFGMNVHPYENMYIKSKRHSDDIVIDRLTEWHDGAGWRSWDRCR